MGKIFLSYTYRPHPDFERETDRLARAARMVIESTARVRNPVSPGFVHS
jgi:hypothetical protein